jgi:hypothetical protein
VPIEPVKPALPSWLLSQFNFTPTPTFNLRKISRPFVAKFLNHEGRGLSSDFHAKLKNKIKIAESASKWQSY